MNFKNGFYGLFGINIRKTRIGEIRWSSDHAALVNRFINIGFTNCPNTLYMWAGRVSIWVDKEKKNGR